MQALHLWLRLPMVAQLGLTLLVGCVLALGAAIRYDTAALPTLSVQDHPFHIVAFTRYYPAPPCPTQSVAPDAYFVVWIIHDSPTSDQPNHKTAMRLLIVPLPHEGDISQFMLPDNIY